LAAPYRYEGVRFRLIFVGDWWNFGLPDFIEIPNPGVAIAGVSVFVGHGRSRRLRVRLRQAGIALGDQGAFPGVNFSLDPRDGARSDFDGRGERSVFDFSMQGRLREREARKHLRLTKKFWFTHVSLHVSGRHPD
jgi:hypothetical protein